MKLVFKSHIITRIKLIYKRKYENKVIIKRYRKDYRKSRNFTKINLYE